MQRQKEDRKKRGNAVGKRVSGEQRGVRRKEGFGK